MNLSQDWRVRQNNRLRDCGKQKNPNPDIFLFFSLSRFLSHSLSSPIALPPLPPHRWSCSSQLLPTNSAQQLMLIRSNSSRRGLNASPPQLVLLSWSRMTQNEIENFKARQARTRRSSIDAGGGMIASGGIAGPQPGDGLRQRRPSVCVSGISIPTGILVAASMTGSANRSRQTIARRGSAGAPRHSSAERPRGRRSSVGGGGDGAAVMTLEAAAAAAASDYLLADGERDGRLQSFLGSNHGFVPGSVYGGAPESVYGSVEGSVYGSVAGSVYGSTATGLSAVRAWTGLGAGEGVGCRDAWAICFVGAPACVSMT